MLRLLELDFVLVRIFLVSVLSCMVVSKELITIMDKYKYLLAFTVLTITTVPVNECNSMDLCCILQVNRPPRRGLLPGVGTALNAPLRTSITVDSSGFKDMAIETRTSRGRLPHSYVRETFCCFVGKKEIIHHIYSETIYLKFYCSCNGQRKGAGAEPGPPLRRSVVDDATEGAVWVLVVFRCFIGWLYNVC